jgi:hypothetical protein
MTDQPTAAGTAGLPRVVDRAGWAAGDPAGGR